LLHCTKKMRMTVQDRHGEEEAALPIKDQMSKEFKEITGNMAAMRGLGKQNYMKVSEIACRCALSIEKGCTRIIVHSGKSRVHPASSILHITQPAEFKTSFDACFSPVSVYHWYWANIKLWSVTLPEMCSRSEW
jgi:hypothetical protein